MTTHVPDHCPSGAPPGVLVLVLAALLGLDAAAQDRPDRGRYDYYVSPFGHDANRGDDWRSPLRSIQRALELAGPGQRVSIAAGDYLEDLRSVRDGEPGAPISLLGAPGATIRGAGRARVVEIRHSHLVLANLDVDGEVPRRGGGVEYRDKLVYLMGRDESGVTGVRLLNLRLRNAGGECVRMKYFAHRNELAYSSVHRCGIEDFELGGGGKNGEGLYIGTAPEQLDRNPTATRDASNDNWVHHNRFDTRGNECVDVKEGSSGNVIEHNGCTGQRDPNAGGVSLRGSRNVVRFNRIHGNRGAGIRLGGDGERDGVENDVYGNVLEGNGYSAFKVMREPQRRICGNLVGSGGGRVVRGRHGASVDPTAPCDGALDASR